MPTDRGENRKLLIEALREYTKKNYRLGLITMAELCGVITWREWLRLNFQITDKVKEPKL